jgi:hypothetical protein
MTTSRPAFSYTHTVETDVPAAEIWALYEDVRTWPLWDAQAQAVTRDGPFAAGTAGTMTFTGQDPLPDRLVKVDPEREFIDETPVGELVVRVSHRLEPAGRACGSPTPRLPAVARHPVLAAADARGPGPA